VGVEVERKFLVSGQSWRAGVESSTRIVQGYLAQTSTTTVRVRVRGERGYLTIKGASVGITRSEFEYEIPADDALAMLAELALEPAIDKVRHLVPVGQHTWEVDVFAGANAPLVMAEVELASVDEPFVRPPWAGQEVSDDPRYFNVNLAREPYSTWAR
jgi:adenylate cyclase